MNTDDILLTGQVALITGGASGIGQGIAMGMAEFGADIVIADIDGAAGEQTARRICEMGRRALSVPTDVTDGDQIQAAVERTGTAFGRLDILVNNAGGSRPAPFVKLSDRSIRRQIDINLTNLFIATHAAARAMIAAERGGSIINISSIEGLRAAPGFSVYAACKAGMVSFTKTMALELAEHKIRVNAIAPDFVPTAGIQRMNPEVMSDAQIKARRRYIPLGRDGNLEDCAAASIFLSSKMASYITGTTLSVDGGTFASSGWTRDDEGGWSPIPTRIAFA